MYVDPKIVKDVDTYVEAAKESDWEREVAAELLQVSQLRELKRRRFVTALAGAGVSFFTMMTFQVLRSLGVVG